MAEIQFEFLTAHTAVARGPANVGIYVTGDGSAILIDSGNDAEAGKKLYRALETANLRLKAIVITHSNADHSGGASWLRAKTGCGIMATRMEAAVMRDPVLETNLLWGGRPPRPLLNKFLMAEACEVTDVIASSGPIPGTPLEAIPLPGHFLDMIGVMTPDSVFFCADSVASEAILAKYTVFYLRDPGLHLSTIGSLASHGASWFVPSHAEPCRDITSLVAANEAKILEISAAILSACAKPAAPDEILSALSAKYGLQVNHAQYALVGSTVRSYLSWLFDGGKVQALFDGGTLRYEASRP